MHHATSPKPKPPAPKPPAPQGKSAGSSGKPLPPPVITDYASI